MFTGRRFINACRRRYGNAVTFSAPFDQQFVMGFHPALIRYLPKALVRSLRS